MASHSNPDPQQLLSLSQEDPHLTLSQLQFPDSTQPFTLITIRAKEEPTGNKRPLGLWQEQLVLAKTTSQVTLTLRPSPAFPEHQPLSTRPGKVEKGQPNSAKVSVQGMRAAMETIRRGKSIEVVRVELPHGDSVEVSHLSGRKKWLFRNNKRVLAVSSKEELIQLQKVQSSFYNLCKVWNIILQQQQGQEGLRLLLKDYTLCGKLTRDAQHITWHALVRNQASQTICEDPFDAKGLIDKHSKLKFVKIKSLGILKNEDQVVRVVENAALAVAECQCQMANGKYGNARIVFVQSDTQEVVGGCELLTLEDKILKVMQNALLEAMDLNGCKSKLKGEYLMLVKQYGQQPPYPYYYYQRLMATLFHLGQVSKLKSSQIMQDWFRLVKLCLYINSKCLSLSQYAPLLLYSPLMAQIASIPLESFGPLNCNITIVYCFITLQGQVHRQIAQQLSQHYKQLEIPFTYYPSQVEGYCVIDIKKIASRIASVKKDKKIRHFFLGETPRVYQINSLLRELQKNSGEEDYFKICLITEKKEDHAVIDQNEYPVSLSVIARAYEEVYLQVQKEALLENKVKEMRKVTQNLEALRNYELEMCGNCIEVELNAGEVDKSVSNAIQGILTNESTHSKVYYPLLAKLDKLKSVKMGWELEEVCRTVMQCCLLKPPTLSVLQQ